MNATMILRKYSGLLTIVLLLTGVGCATSIGQQPTVLGPLCSITWDKPNDQKVTGYQLTVIDQNKQAKRTVRFIPASITKVSCKDAGADHEGEWGVTVQSCYDKSTCGSPTEIAHIQITAK
ncbi:MAG: hypothetical protein E8D47_08820 [Nitrospira sp.]|nr:MAG: hypothetical protein E8D47_08820 [Nitrospira sp.]